MCCAQTAAPEGRKNNDGKCNSMAATASIKTFVNKAQGAAKGMSKEDPFQKRSAFAFPGRRSTKKLQSPSATGASSTSSRQCVMMKTHPRQAQHDFRPSQLQAQHCPQTLQNRGSGVPGEAKFAPEAPPTRQGRFTSAKKGSKSRPRSAQRSPRVAPERPKASQVAPKSYPRGARDAAKPSPASPKTSFEHDPCG